MPWVRAREAAALQLTCSWVCQGGKLCLFPQEHVQAREERELSGVFLLGLVQQICVEEQGKLSEKGAGGRPLKACGMRTEPQRPPGIELEKLGVKQTAGRGVRHGNSDEWRKVPSRDKRAVILHSTWRVKKSTRHEKWPVFLPQACLNPERSTADAGGWEMWDMTPARQGTAAAASNPELSMTSQS